jgi:hypothetical protein
MERNQLTNNLAEVYLAPIVFVFLVT